MHFALKNLCTDHYNVIAIHVSERCIRTYLFHIFLACLRSLWHRIYKVADLNYIKIIQFIHYFRHHFLISWKPNFLPDQQCRSAQLRNLWSLSLKVHVYLFAFFWLLVFLDTMWFDLNFYWKNQTNIIHHLCAVNIWIMCL